MACQALIPVTPRLDFQPSADMMFISQTASYTIMRLGTKICIITAHTMGGYLVYDFRSRPTPTAKPISELYPDLTSGGKVIQDRKGCKIAYAECGSTDRNAWVLIFFHGLPGSRIIPVPGLRDLCNRRRVRLIAIDRPGIGLTSPPVETEISTFDISSLDVQEVLQDIGCGSNNVGLIGYSMGGPYALQFVRGYHQAVDKLYLIAPAGYVISKEGYKRSSNWDYIWEKHDPSEESMCAPNRAAHFLSRFALSVLHTGWNLLASKLVHEDSYADDLFQATSPGDRENLTEDDCQVWRITTRETFRHGIHGMLNAVLEAFGKRAPSGWSWNVEDLRGIVGQGTVETNVYAARTDWLTPLSGVVELADLIGVDSQRFKVYEEGIGHVALLRHALNEILEGEGGAAEFLKHQYS